MAKEPYDKWQTIGYNDNGNDDDSERVAYTKQ
jgi:hypothetical protein